RSRKRRRGRELAGSLSAEPSSPVTRASPSIHLAGIHFCPSKSQPRHLGFEFSARAGATRLVGPAAASPKTANVADRASILAPPVLGSGISDQDWVRGAQTRVDCERSLAMTTSM